MPNPNFLCGTAPAFFQASKWSMVIFSIRSHLKFNLQKKQSAILPSSMRDMSKVGTGIGVLSSLSHAGCSISTCYLRCSISSVICNNPRCITGWKKAARWHVQLQATFPVNITTYSNTVAWALFSTVGSSDLNGKFRSTCLLEKSRSILLKLSAICKLHLHFSAASYYCKSAYQLTHSIRNITFGTETTRSSIYTSVQDNNNNNMPERPALYIAVMSRPLISQCLRTLGLTVQIIQTWFLKVDKQTNQHHYFDDGI